MNTPSQALAAKITERLVSEGLITLAASKALESKLADGTLRTEDWRLPIELAGRREPKA
jgi:hypothetical protein